MTEHLTEKSLIEGPWVPEQWGPETVETYRCPHGKHADDYCEECEKGDE